MDKVFAWDHHNERVVYREPGKSYPDGRTDSDFSPVWLTADIEDLPPGVDVDQLRSVSVGDDE